METRKTVKPYPAELRERLVRMVREQTHEHGSEWAAMRSVAAKVGCTAETLRQWVRKSERDRGERGVLTSEDRARLKALGRENRELREANEILRKASA
jgi:transposase-like protein